ncbi:MAG: PRC-barrel domain-containing protein [Chloroflexi bacterium]|nr:PRC-barrel domain-containing protein [Chloroflexota bacterium]
MEVNIGAEVITSDGQKAGHVDRVIVLPEQDRLISIVVHKGFFLPRDVVVPTALIAAADRKTVSLKVTARELEKMPEFIPENYTVPPTHWTPPSIYVPAHVLVPVPGYVDISGSREELQTKAQEAQRGERVPSGGVELSEGTEVDCRDGRVGTIQEVIFAPVSQEVTAIVVRAGMIRTNDFVVPANWIAEARNDRVLLNCTKTQLERLPRR